MKNKEEKQSREERRAGGRLRNLKKALGMELREHKSSFIVYFVLAFPCYSNDDSADFKQEL